jgi:cobalamin biosynthesis Mg chelatase CobN
VADEDDPRINLDAEQARQAARLDAERLKRVERAEAEQAKHQAKQAEKDAAQRAKQAEKDAAQRARQAEKDAAERAKHAEEQAKADAKAAKKARRRQPPVARGNQSTAEDIALLRAHPDVRNRVIAAAVVPFVLYIVVLLLTGSLGLVLIWAWIPFVTAGVVAGSIVDAAHRKRAQK